MMMNGWFLAAGALLAAAFFVHVFSGNRFYSAARPDAATAPSGAYEAWLMGRCGVQMISVDLFLCAAFLLLLGTSVLRAISRSNSCCCWCSAAGVAAV